MRSTSGHMREEINTLGFGESQLQFFGGGECDKPANSCVLIRVQPKQVKAGEDQNAADQAVAHGDQDQAGSGVTVCAAPRWSAPRSARNCSTTASSPPCSPSCMIAIYVAVRFEWQYGIGAAIATGHDVLVTAGLFSVFHLDFSLTAVAALLTLAGYSINDTVVVFDRIRENRRKYKRMTLADLINLSTNQMVTRTILTSAATAISLLPLLIFGGPALFDFSAPILFGIVVGTFSSIYVAAALLLYLPAPAGTVEGPAEATA